MINVHCIYHAYGQCLVLLHVYCAIMQFMVITPKEKFHNLKSIQSISPQVSRLYILKSFKDGIKR